MTNNQIYNHLIEVNHVDLWQTINHDSELLDLVRTPLLLSITILAFQEISIDILLQLISTKDRIQYLLNAYVLLMLKREIKNNTYSKNKLPNNEQTQLWPIWLAQQLQKEFKTEFLIEKLQPSGGVFDFSEYVLFYRLISGLIFQVIFFFPQTAYPLIRDRDGSRGKRQR